MVRPDYPVSQRMNFNCGFWDYLFGRLAAKSPLALVVFIAGLGYYAGQPPIPVPATAGPELSSAERAMGHSPNFAREPHPAGSEALAHLWEYLLAPLNNCSVEAQIQRATVIEGHSISYVADSQHADGIGHHER